MIKTENYGAGVRWHCTECDELYNEHGRLTIHYTNSTPPADCQRCGEEAMLVIWLSTFLSIVCLLACVSRGCPSPRPYVCGTPHARVKSPRGIYRGSPACHTRADENATTTQETRNDEIPNRLRNP